MTDSDSSYSTLCGEPVARLRDDDNGKSKSKKKKKKDKKKHAKKRRRDVEDCCVGTSVSVCHDEENDGNGSRDDSSAEVECVLDEDPSSSSTMEEPNGSKAGLSSHEKKKSKKSKKNKKRKRSNSSVDDDDSTQGDDSSSSGGGGSGKKSKKEKHNKKSSKKKSKHKKTIRQQQSQDEMGDESPASKSSNNKSEKSKGKNKKSHEMDAKVVSSSAIEYLPDDLKLMQLKKNQETALAAEGATVAADCNSKLDTKATTPAKIANEHAPEKTVTDSNSEGSPPAAKPSKPKQLDNITLLLFYQYVEPPWDESQFKTALSHVTARGEHHGITGRMRVAREGLNCTLTGAPEAIRGWCADMRAFDGGRSKIDPETGETITEFARTEFKLTDDLPPKQRFPKLHPFEVVELVNYGLAGSRAPKISEHGGTHLEPTEYHQKMCEKDTVIIDVRNHYEANIGRFAPPVGGAKMIDPMMRKSTEFPMWLDRKETKEMLRGKQVLMYCTGGVRCERASALLKQKIDNEDDTKELGIKGVFQLQGGVDKYFKDFPAGGLWKGKNYTFDKRFAHAPPAVEAVERKKKVLGDDEQKLDESSSKQAEKKDGTSAGAKEEILGKCEACLKPWDMYRGKRRCPTCGVPSLICRTCFEADKTGTKKLGREIRCDMCVADDIWNKKQLREREEKETKAYELKLRQKLGNEEYEAPTQRKHAITRKPKPNPELITRLFLKNMCAKRMDEAALIEMLHPARATHVQWLLDRNTGKFYGSAFVEVKSPEDAGSALALDGSFVLGRKIKVKYQKADEKDIWPIPNTEVPSA